jgi:hypothetical protein
LPQGHQNYLSNSTSKVVKSVAASSIKTKKKENNESNKLNKALQEQIDKHGEDIEVFIEAPGMNYENICHKRLHK